MAFDDNKQAFSQHHFTIVEIDIPIVSGTCTLGGQAGYGTALTCDQPTNATQTYRFTTLDAPTLPVSGVYRCIQSISESATELQSGRGLSSRGSININFVDFKGDPNPLAPAVTNTVKNNGSFLAKLDARNILANRPIRIKNYRIVDGVYPDFDNDAETRHYLIESFESKGGGKWVARGKDELSRFNINEKLYPEPTDGYLTQAIADTGTRFYVDPNNQYTAGMVLRVGDELFKVTGVGNIGSAGAYVDAAFRGSAINSIHLTNRSEHSAGDEVFICKVFSGASIDDVLTDICTTVGIDSQYMPSGDWASEIAVWHSATTVNTIFVEAEDANDVLAKMLTSYMLDMWFDPVDREIKLSAISVWRQSVATLTEGVQIDYDTIKRQARDDLRATNALVVYNKPYLTSDDAIENYKKASLFSNSLLESSDYYGERKQKRFDNNPIIDDNAAELLTRRFIARYGITPQAYTWKAQENKLSYKTGDVVSILTDSKVGFDGQPDGSTRAQITSIKPNYNGIGRDYTVKALTYAPAINESGVVNDLVISGNQSQITLYNEAGGAIPEAVNLTFVLDGAQVSSTSAIIPALRLGAFPSGSVITIILINGATVQGKGGDGGTGGTYLIDDDPTIPDFGTNGQSGFDGGVAVDCDGVEVNIYLSGATGNATYPNADGYIFAPGGGGAGGPADPLSGDPLYYTGSGGGGGAGSTFGLGGSAGAVPDDVRFESGATGNNGTSTGNGGAGLDGSGAGGGYGQNGSANAVGVAGGLAGKGVVDSGGVVTLYGATALRYINGNGDH